MAWSEYRKGGPIADAYFVSAGRAKFLPADHETVPGAGHAARTSLARFTVRLHERGDLPRLTRPTSFWEYDGATGYRFPGLIDINRMRFHARPLRPDE